MNLSLGTMVIGDQLPTVEQGKALVEAWRGAGLEAVDTAFLYPGVKSQGVCEKMLGDAAVPGCVYSTKANSWTEGGLSAESVARQLRGSVERLQVKKVDIFYLHMPDHKVPLAETLKAVNDLFEEGLFARFGLSNYASWEVADIVHLCKENGWVKPSVYQGMYNCLTRAVEAELLLCLRHFDIEFVAYNITCGGFIETVGSNDRFKNSMHSTLYNGRYVHDAYSTAATLVKEACEKHNMSAIEAAIRWMVHHSKLTSSDTLIVGASKIAHLQSNVQAAREGGALPDALVAVLDEAAQVARPKWPMYHRTNNDWLITK